VSPKGVDKNGSIQFEIKAAVSIPPEAFIRAGYSANASIVLKRAENILTIPESTVEFSKDSSFVYLLKEETPKQVFERHQIVTGLSDGIRIEVKEGLTADDKIRGAAIDPKAKKEEEGEHNYYETDYYTCRPFGKPLGRGADNTALELGKLHPARH
jgi:HlyD family secretion protein